MIADEIDNFSEKVIKLYQDEELWNNVSNNCIEYIRLNYSYEKSKDHIETLIESLL